MGVSSAMKHFIARTGFDMQRRKLDQESRKRGDDPWQDSEIVPLTPSQWEFVKQEKASPRTGINNIAGALVIDDSTDVDLFREAINTVIKNNDGMRIVFTQEGESLSQYAARFEPLNTPVLSFDSEESMRQYCDSEKRKPFGSFIDQDICKEIDIFRLSDGRGGLIIREHHMRNDAVGSVAFLVYVMDVYEHLKKGTKNYEGVRTSFIDYARNPKVRGTERVDHIDPIDCSSTRTEFMMTREGTARIKKVCENLGRSVGLNIRPSKLFELGNAIFIGQRNGNSERITLDGLATGRTPKTSESLTIGMFTHGQPLTMYLDWKRSVKDNIVNAKKRARGLLGTPDYSSSSDPSDTISISFRSEIGILKDLFKTPFRIYESPRDYSPIPLFMQIEDMNETGSYNVFYDAWNALYTREQIEERHTVVMSIINQMVGNPDMILKDLLV
ncbi:MAG: condensation domain-containing protein [Propionibacteriaceae bacterium]|jgi:hypothetical protein|nr:condensation domain-containing protein [Propionibacteriaceae bacterium]